MTEPYAIYPIDNPVRPRVLILAADLLARAGLAAILASLPDLEIVGQSPLDENLPAAVTAFRPDVLLWDLGYADETELEHLASRMEDEFSDAESVRPPTLGLLLDVESAPQAWSLGLRALLPRSTPPTTLAAALRAAALGLVVYDPRLTLTLQPAGTGAQLHEQLTPREQEVLQLIAQGLPNKTIARALQISEHTVKFHVNAILGKLGAQSRTEAVVRASRAGLVIL